MDDLQILQNRAAKVIPNLPSYAPSADDLKTLDWPALLQRLLVHRYIPTFKYIHGLVDYNGYNTRRKNDFRLPLVKRNYGK